MKNFQNSTINSKPNRGISLILALVIMTALLGIGLAISAILMAQIRMIRGMGDSVVAFYAADSGIEEVLVKRESPDNLSGQLENNATYRVYVSAGGVGDCQAAHFCIKSVGNYRGVTRAIEVEY